MIELFREHDSGLSTIGSLYIDGEFICYTLENSWKDNQRQVSCIPTGTYTFGTKTYGRYYESYGHPILKLFDVPNRAEILIHIGNYPKDTLGCILLGKSKGVDFIGSSRVAYNEAYPLLVNQQQICIQKD